MRRAAVILALLCPAVALAQPGGDRDAARGHADLGQRAIDAGDFGRALAEYQEAYRLFPSPLILINVARAESGLGRILRAIELLRQVEGDASVGEPHRREVAAEIARLRRLVASVVIEVRPDGAEVSVNHVAVGRSPLGEPVLVDPGTVIVDALIEGRGGAGWIGEVAAGARQIVTLDVQTRAVPPTARRPAPAPAIRRANGVTTLFWASAIGAAALTAAGSVFGVLTAIDHGRYEGLGGCPATMMTGDDHTACDLRDRGLLRAGLSTGFFIGAGLAAAAAILLYGHRDAPSETGPAHARVGLGTIVF